MKKNHRKIRTEKRAIYNSLFAEMVSARLLGEIDQATFANFISLTQRGLIRKYLNKFHYPNNIFSDSKGEIIKILHSSKRRETIEGLLKTRETL